MVSEHANPLAAVGGVDAGGQNVHVAALAAELGRRGASVVVHTRWEGGGPRRLPLSSGVTVDHVPAGPPRPVPKDELVPWLGTLSGELARAWRHQRPDVVHAHFWMSGWAALDAAAPLGIPVVQTFHALGSVKRRWQGEADTSPPVRLPVERLICRRADRIVATCSDEVFELVRLGADAHHTSVVPCGVDLSLFRPEGPTAARRPGLRRLVSVGRLVERKGLADVVTAVAALPGTELVVAGGPPAAGLPADDEARRLQALAERLGVGDRVRLVGRLSRPEVAALLRSADVAVAVPWYEPFGIVPLEAMACGVPVVAANVGGLTDSVVSGVTGTLVPPRSPGAVAAAVRRLLDDEDRRRALGEAGARRARRCYGWRSVAAATERILGAVVAAGPVRSRPGQARHSLGALA